MRVKSDDIAQLLASAPPRQVPKHVAKAVGVRHNGWSFALFSLFYGIGGLFFVATGFPWRLIDEWRLAAAGKTVPGVVRFAKDCVPQEEGGIRQYDFDFVDHDNQSRHGECFAKGERWNAGAKVTIRYLPASPQVALIEGAQLDRNGWSGIFVLLFPLIGFGFFAKQVISVRRTWWLWRCGAVQEVEIVSVEETTATENYQSVYRIVVRSPALNGGQLITIKRVNKAEVQLAFSRAREQQPVFVLYDPRDTNRLVFPEALIFPLAAKKAGSFDPA